MLNVRLSQSTPIALDTTLTCGAGELLALVGPSGSGKTSVLRAVAGLLNVTEGEVVFDGVPWFDSAAGINVPPERRPVGMVFQHYALFPHLMALHNVVLALPAGSPAEAGRSLLSDMKLDALADRRPHELSGGQRQRVALARALARQPRVLLLDEAFSAVDQPTRHLLYDELIRLRERVSLPIVMVTHDLREARLLADRLCILDGGHTLQDGTPEAVLSRPRNARVATLVGVRDIHEGVFHVNAHDSGRARLQWGEGPGGIELRTSDKGRLQDGTRVRWVIPGEHVQIHEHAVACDNLVPCTVERLRRLGEITTLECRTQAPPRAALHLELTTRLVERMQLHTGAAVFLELQAAGIHIMPVRNVGRRG